MDLLSGESDPSNEDVRALDVRLSEAFDQVLCAKLNDPSDNLDRIHFLVAQVRKLIDAEGIVADILKTIVEDANLLANMDVFESPTLQPLDEKMLAHVDMTELCYQSQVSASLSPKELNAICAEACKKNRKNDVTGILTYDYMTGSILQILEGPSVAVNALIESISKDTRHFDVTIKHQGKIENRFFGHWAMFLITSSDVKSEIGCLEEIDAWIHNRLGVNANCELNKSLWFLSESVRSMREQS